MRKSPAPQEGFWQVLALGLIATAALFLINQQGWSSFGGGFLAFLILYRTLYLYFITVSRPDTFLYCCLAVCLSATAVLVIAASGRLGGPWDRCR